MKIIVEIYNYERLVHITALDTKDLEGDPPIIRVHIDGVLPQPITEPKP